MEYKYSLVYLTRGSLTISKNVSLYHFLVTVKLTSIWHSSWFKNRGSEHVKSNDLSKARVCSWHSKNGIKNNLEGEILLLGGFEVESNHRTGAGEENL